ncbi:hypothetical protein ID866_8707 [Astraeus odoratus]|nr:hypothetical protein ID866_8707 [Astraeus odoratus]
MHYKITNLGPMSWLLGMQVTHDREAHTISLSQQTYINAILAKYNLTNAKPVSIPMDPSLRLLCEQSLQSIKATMCMKNMPYHAAVRPLMHLAVRTHPDITFTISTMVQFNNKPGMAYLEVVKCIYRYLAGTKMLALTFSSIEKGLEGFMDADGASQEHQQAILGYAYLLNGGTISWASCNLELITLSTTEAEYIAAMHPTNEGLWLRHLISKVFCLLKHPTPLYSDSQSAIALTKDGSYHMHSKLIDIQYHSFISLLKIILFISFIALQKIWLLTCSLKHYLLLKLSIFLLHLDFVPIEGEC